MNVEAGCCLTESPGYAHSLFLGRGQKRCASKSRNKPCKTILIFFPQCSHKGPRRKHAGCLCSSLKRLQRYHCESCTVWLGRRLSINPHGFTSPLFPHRSLATVKTWWPPNLRYTIVAQTPTGLEVFRAHVLSVLYERLGLKDPLESHVIELQVPLVADLSWWEDARSSSCSLIGVSKALV